MSAAPTHRKGSMPKNGGPMRQPVRNHGTKPKIVPGAMMKNTSDPSEAHKRRMVIPNERATRLGVGWCTLDRHLAPSGTFSTRAVLEFAQIIAGATHTSGIACARSLGVKMPEP